MTPDEKIKILTDALKRIANCKDSPSLDPSGDIQLGLHCGIEDRYIDTAYDAADFGYTEGAEDAMEWATNEASFALQQLFDCGEAEDGWPCFKCNGGTIQVAYKEYSTTRGDGDPFTIPNVPIWTCGNCGHESFDKNASQIIEEARITAGVKYRR